MRLRGHTVTLWPVLLLAEAGWVAGFVRQCPWQPIGLNRPHGVAFRIPPPLSRNTNPALFYSSQSDLNDKNVVDQMGAVPDPTSLSSKKSAILSIACHNLAGAVAPDGRPIHVSLAPSQPFLACTGETGSGKSLLFAKAVDLIVGGRATASLVGGKDLVVSDHEQSAFVELVLGLQEPHVSFVQVYLENLGIDLGDQWNTKDAAAKLLTIRRTLIRSSTPRAKLKSVCTVNGQPITLKALSTLTSPLLVVVDASAAAVALSQPGARLALLDTGVNPAVQQFFAASQREYRRCRKVLQEIERELASRVLPQSFSMDSEEDLAMVNHWIAEMEGLRSRVAKFVDVLSTDGRESNSLIQTMKNLQETDWMANDNEKEEIFSSALYERLRQLRDAVRSLDNQWTAANNAIEVLSSLSIAESAATAMEKSRKLLFDAVEGDIDSDRLDEASETCHSLLNDAEAALAKCTRFIEDDDRGLLATIENLRSSCPVSVETIDELILDWNTIARKHGISPQSLPSCHKSMIRERDGNVEALALLPKAQEAERDALENFEQACELLSADRKRVSEDLIAAVNSRLPALGMNASAFDIVLDPTARSCTDTAAFAIGLDSVEFNLHQGESSVGGASSVRTGGALDRVASSGEKARILLAMECSLPGCIRATINSNKESSIDGIPPVPITVIYDEIDAHVGGSAAVALGHMLADQSLQTQVIAITHSPAVAASADAHVVVQKNLQHDEMRIKVEAVSEADRQLEVGRMASLEYLKEKFDEW